MAKTKVQITMDSDLLNELDMYCDSNYMNRSWAIQQAVIQLVNQQKIVDSIVTLSTAISKALDKGVVDKDTMREIETFETLSKMVIGRK